MSSLRRLTALLSGLLLLQLALLGGRPSCASHAAGSHASTMAMQGAHGAHDAALAAVPTDACGTERAADRCASMPSCARAIGMPPGIVTRVALVPVTSARLEPAALHSHPAAAPDAPPPRG